MRFIYICKHDHRLHRPGELRWCNPSSWLSAEPENQSRQKCFHTVLYIHYDSSKWQTTQISLPPLVIYSGIYNNHKWWFATSTSKLTPKKCKTVYILRGQSCGYDIIFTIFMWGLGRQASSQMLRMKFLITIFSVFLHRWVQESLSPKYTEKADSELTIHSVTLWIPDIEAGGFHVARKDIPPFIFKPKCRLCSCWTWSTFYRRQMGQRITIKSHPDNFLFLCSKHY